MAVHHGLAGCRPDIEPDVAPGTKDSRIVLD
jgi:hypothetical protein